MIRIAQAGSDEWGGIYGGNAGDQRKTNPDANGCFDGELSIKPWYNKPWTHLLRCNDPKKAETIALAFEKICRNAKVGYDQSQDETLWAECEKIGWDLNDVDKIGKCECDCCRLYDVALRFAGINASNQKHWYTGNVRAGVVGTGLFTVYTDAAHIASTNKLKRGDALLQEGHHIVVVLDSSEIAEGDPYKATGDVWMRTGGSTSYSKIKVISKGEVVNVHRIVNGWAYADHKGNIGYVSMKYLAPMGKMKTTGDVWQRKSAGITGGKIQVVTGGTEVISTGNTKKVLGTVWYEVIYSGYTGWCSGKYLK